MNQPFVASDNMISVSVAVRLRPPMPSDDDDSSCIRVLHQNRQIVVENGHRFTFDHVFSEESTQVQLYEDSVAGLLHAVMSGYNATVLAYGQTGSGKTYTMGSATNLGVPIDKKGIIPRVVEDLFYFIKSSKEADKELKYTVKCQFVEVYGEFIRDLLSHESDNELILRETSEGEVFLAGCPETPVSSANELLMFLEKGSLHRTTGATMMNEHSSRSHAVLIVHVSKGRDDVIDTQSKFSFVDLAGSERAKRTQSEGVRFREGIEINKGLLALGNVICVLGDDSKRGQHVPYRDSKLTRLLQDSLGGNSKTLMICCVSPQPINLQESLNVLKYANRARNIKNKPVLNKDVRNAKIDELKLHINLLASELLSGRNVINISQADIDELISNLSKKHNTVIQSTIACEKVTITAKDPTMNILNDRMIELTAEVDVLKTRLGDAIDYNEDVVLDVGALNDFERVIYDNYKSLADSSSLKSFMSLLVHYMKKSNRPNDDRIEAVDDGMESMMIGLIARTHESLIKETQMLSNYEDVSTDVDLEETDRLFRQKQKNIQFEVTDLSESISIKNQLLDHLKQSQANYDKMKLEYESRLQSMFLEVCKLESERKELIDQIDTSHVDNKQILISSLADKDRQLQQLKQKHNELERLLTVKSKSRDRLNELSVEITSMKRQKIELTRKLDTERRSHTRSFQAKVQEIEQLRRNYHKASEDLKIISTNHIKSEQVIKKQAEEVNSYKKRIQDIVKDGLLNRELSSRDQKRKEEILKAVGNLSQKKHLIYRLVSEYESKLKIMKLREDLDKTSQFNALESMSSELKLKDDIISDLECSVDKLSSIEPGLTLVDISDSNLLFDILAQTKCQLDSEKRKYKGISGKFKAVQLDFTGLESKYEGERRHHRIEMDRLSRDFEIRLHEMENASFQTSSNQLVMIANERCEVFKMESDRSKSRIKLMEQEVNDLNSILAALRQQVVEKDESIKYFERDLNYFINAYEQARQGRDPSPSQDNQSVSPGKEEDDDDDDKNNDEEANSSIAKFAHITRELLTHAQLSKDEPNMHLLSDGRTIFDRLSNPDSFTGTHRIKMAERQRSIVKVKSAKDKPIVVFNQPIMNSEEDDLLVEDSSQPISKNKLVVDPFPVLEDLNLIPTPPEEPDKYLWLLDDYNTVSKPKKVDVAAKGVFNRLTSQMTHAALEKRKSKTRRSDS